jgi:hypothetical protein
MHFMHNATIVYIQVRVFMQTIMHKRCSFAKNDTSGSEVKIMEILEEYLGLVKCLYSNFMQGFPASRNPHRTTKPS